MSVGCPAPPPSSGVQDFPQNGHTSAAMHRQSLPLANTGFPGLGPRRVLFHRLVLALEKTQTHIKGELEIGCVLPLEKTGTPKNWGGGGNQKSFPKGNNSHLHSLTFPHLKTIANTRKSIKQTSPFNAFRPGEYCKKQLGIIFHIVRVWRHVALVAAFREHSS